RAHRRGHHRGRACARARDPPRRRGLRRRHPQHARSQPLEVHRRRPARARAPAGQGRAGRSEL
ncbi:MAG: FIG00814129: Possible chaperone, partial [uncultured Solirubrobacteraceae bacterium]